MLYMGDDDWEYTYCSSLIRLHGNARKQIETQKNNTNKQEEKGLRISRRSHPGKTGRFSYLRNSYDGTDS